MEVIVQGIHMKVSKNDGEEYYHIYGNYTDDTGRYRRGHTYIDPKNDNIDKWQKCINTVLDNRGFDFRVSGIRMKNKKMGLWNADSRPTVEEILDKPLKSSYKKPKDEPDELPSDLFTF